MSDIDVELVISPSDEELKKLILELLKIHGPMHIEDLINEIKSVYITGKLRLRNILREMIVDGIIIELMPSIVALPNQTNIELIEKAIYSYTKHGVSRIRALTTKVIYNVSKRKNKLVVYKGSLALLALDLTNLKLEKYY